MSFFKKQDSDDRLSLFLRLVVYLSASLAGLATVFIVGYILLKGIPFLRPELFSWTYNSENVSMLPALLNTILMAILALLIALPIGIGASVYLTEYAKSGNPLVTVVRLATETLSGIPSVIYGLFGALFFVKFLNLGLSIVAGAATLSIMILPLIMRTTEEALLSVEDGYREGSFAIGAGKLRTIFQVVLPSALPGIFSGVVLAFPYIVWEIWKFISPALMPNEKKNSIFYINAIWILFMTGVLTGYFLILPFAINFGLLFKVSDNIVQLFDLSDYTTLFLQVTMGMGVVFLFPIAVYILTSIGILTPKFLRTYRRHAIVLIMVVAAIITPADVLSMMAAALPLVLLYEISVVMSNIIYKKMQKKST